jgi:hypothetical protein
LLLARGLPLAEAESIVGKYGDEFAPEVRAYVRASRKRQTLMPFVELSGSLVPLCRCPERERPQMRRRPVFGFLFSGVDQTHFGVAPNGGLMALFVALLTTLPCRFFCLLQIICKIA